jgi:hypothetical protein
VSERCFLLGRDTFAESGRHGYSAP